MASTQGKKSRIQAVLICLGLAAFDGIVSAFHYMKQTCTFLLSLYLVKTWSMKTNTFYKPDRHLLHPFSKIEYFSVHVSF